MIMEDLWRQGFQSTPPARGATTFASVESIIKCNFNPRPPRGGRLQWHGTLMCFLFISIHAPREGGDIVISCVCEFGFAFQSTPPARGATSRFWLVTLILLISIHAPREGGDFYTQNQGRYRPISIHAPREGGDVGVAGGEPPAGISIHAPREGGDGDTITLTKG